MRTAMVERVPRALTGFDEVKNSRSSDFSVALRWFLRSSELRYGSSGSSGRTPGRIPQRSQAQSRKSTSGRGRPYLRGLSGPEVSVVDQRGRLAIRKVPQSTSEVVAGRRTVFINDRMNDIIIIERYLNFLR